MKKDRPTRKPKEIVKAAVATANLVEASARVAVGDHTALPKAASSAWTLYQALNSAWAERRTAELQELLEEAFGANASDQGFVLGLMADFNNHPEMEELFTRMLREWADRISPAVRPGLALLLREYHRTGRPADSFFRGLTRLLCELEAREYAAMADLFKVLDERLPRTSRGANPVAGPTLDERSEYQLRVSWDEHKQTYSLWISGPQGSISSGNFERPHLRRILRLLASNELGRGGDVGMKGEPPVIGLERAVITHIRQLLSPEP